LIWQGRYWMQNGVAELASFLWLLSGYLSVGYVLIGHIRKKCHLREVKKWIDIVPFPSFFVYISDRPPNRMVSMMLLYIKRKARESVLLLLVRCLRLSHCPRSPDEQLQDSPRCTYNNKVHLLQTQRCTKVLTYLADIYRCFCFDFYSETCEISNSQRQKRSKRLSLIYIISVTSCAWLWLYKDSENCIISKFFYKKNNAISAVSYYERPLELLELWIARRYFI
jgi:hypothetical protein